MLRRPASGSYWNVYGGLAAVGVVAAERAVGLGVEARRGDAGRRPAHERLLVGRHRLADGEPTGAALEQRAQRRLGLPRGHRRGVARRVHEPRRLERHVGDAEDLIVELGRDAARHRPVDRHALRDEQLEEREQLAQHRGLVRVDVHAVVGVHAQRRHVGELVEHREEERPGLLVLPRAGEEHRHVDLVGEGRDVEAVVLGRRVVADLARLLDVVDVLAVEELVLRAHGVAAVDHASLPALAVGLGLADHVGDPRGREAVVQDAAGQHRGVGGADHRQRRDRREVRWLRRRDEQLRDAGVRQADHAGLAVHDPRLRGDGLDHVVAVEELHRLEEVEGAARAAGAADVDVDRRVAEERRRSSPTDRWARRRSPAGRRTARPACRRRPARPASTARSRSS
jgi:hypothetical protein